MTYSVHVDLIAMSAVLHSAAERPLTVETLQVCRQHVDRLMALLSNAQPHSDDQAARIRIEAPTGEKDTTVAPVHGDSRCRCR